MIGGRTKGSLARFFRDQELGWCQQAEIVVSDGPSFIETADQFS